tara:strand:- start:45 stop:353 length:309 start_codon:yes stop_codon:yes gene_type:complete
LLIVLFCSFNELFILYIWPKPNTEIFTLIIAFLVFFILNMSMNVNGLSGSVQLKTVPGQGPIVENIGVEPMTFPPVAGRPGPYMTKTLFQYVMNLYFRRNKK